MYIMISKGPTLTGRGSYTDWSRRKSTPKPGVVGRHAAFIHGGNMRATTIKATISAQNLAELGRGLCLDFSTPEKVGILYASSDPMEVREIKLKGRWNNPPLPADKIRAGGFTWWGYYPSDVESMKWTSASSGAVLLAESLGGSSFELTYIGPQPKDLWPVKESLYLSLILRYGNLGSHHIATVLSEQAEDAWHDVLYARFYNAAFEAMEDDGRNRYIDRIRGMATEAGFILPTDQELVQIREDEDGWDSEAADPCCW